MKVILFILFAGITLNAALAPHAAAQANLPAKKKLAAKKKKGPAIPLPEFKAKRTIKLDFATSDETAVVFRPPTAVDKALDESLAQMPAAPVLKEVIAPKPLPTPSPIIEKIEVADELPAPAPVNVPATAAAPTPPPPTPSAPAPPPAPTLVTKIEVAKAEVPTPRYTNTNTRIHLRSGYLAARYSEIESQLQNGASVLGIAIAQNFSAEIEARVLLEASHGLDQSVEPANTRSFLLTSEGLYHWRWNSSFTTYAGLGIGVARFNVRSYRQKSDGTVNLVDHFAGNAIVLTPQIGTQIAIPGSDFGLDLASSYLMALRSDQTSALGGLQLSAAMVFSF